jgi:hypothetical protein
MIDINKRIATIEQLVSEGTVQALTYAALECRLTIEHICYDRLLISHAYISHEDLKTWTPAKVVQQISEEANELVDTGFKISVSTRPLSENCEPKSQADFEAMDYLQIGEQIGFRTRTLNSLWNGLSNVALHITVPSEGIISPYGDLNKIREKILEAIVEFKRLSKGNLIGTSLEDEIKFECLECGCFIKRKVGLLKDGQVIACFNQKCDESYTITLTDGEVEFSPRKFEIICRHCKKKTIFPAKKAEVLKYGSTLEVICSCCSAPTIVKLHIVQET